jgi:hypothetical protein
MVSIGGKALEYDNAQGCVAHRRTTVAEQREIIAGTA